MDFVLFLLVNVALYTRPSEIIPGWQEVELYQYLILPCLVCALPGILNQFEPRVLAQRPITVCVLGMLLAIPLSWVWRGDLGKAAELGLDFFKVVIYFLILMAVLHTPARLHRFLGWLGVLTAVMAVMSLLHYFQVIHLTDLSDVKEALVSSRTGIEETLIRLRGPGRMFGDPNDACAVFIVGLLICCYFVTNTGSWAQRLIWLVPLSLCMYAQVLTYSRGGFLGLVAGLVVLFWARYGWKKSILLGGLTLPGLLLLFAGRAADLSSTSSGTGQDRIRLWSDALVHLRGSPVFGVGKDQFAIDNGGTGLVAHNSFLHCFTELGLFGGMFFLGMFSLAFLSLYRIGRAGNGVVPSELRRLHPFLLAILAAYATSLMSISRGYVVSTYTVVGLIAAYTSLVEQVPAMTLVLPRFDSRLLPRLAGGSVAFLGGIYVFVRLFFRG